jgi:hypothetical protein
MNNLPAKPERPQPADVTAIPTWRELRERFRDVLKDIFDEGKDLERELEPRLVPVLNRLKLELESLIAKLEERAKKRGP